MKKLIIGAIPNNFSLNTHIPLGPFCFLNSGHLFPDWENIEFEQDPAFSRGLLRKYDELTFEYSKRTLKELKVFLNKINGVQYSLNFWKIVAFPWVMSFVQSVFERQKRIEKILEKYSNTPLEVDLVIDNIDWKFKDNYDFNINGILNPIFNEWLFSRMLEGNAPNCWKINYVDKAPEIKNSSDQKSFYRSIKYFIRKTLDKIMPFQPRYGFNNLETIISNIVLYLKFFLKPTRNINKNGPDWNEICDVNIDWIFNFSSILHATIPKGIIELNNHAPLFNKYSFSHESIISTQSVYGDSSILPSLAYLNIYHGKKIIGMQHGGHTYGTAESDCLSKGIDYKLDNFITWGWIKQDNHHGKFVDMPSPMLSKIRNKHSQKTENLIFVGTAVRLYTQRFQSTPQPKQQISYLKEKYFFLNNLHNNIYSKVLHRSSNTPKISFDDKRYIKQYFPDIIILEKHFDEYLLKSKLLVLDHPGTTLNKAFAANIPTIAFWEDAHWPMCSEADQLFKLLRDSGILYANGKEAARKVNEIWSDVNGWWQQNEIQNVRKLWANKYARTSKNWRSEWVKLLWNM